MLRNAMVLTVPCTASCAETQKTRWSMSDCFECGFHSRCCHLVYMERKGCSAGGIYSIRSRERRKNCLILVMCTSAGPYIELSGSASARSWCTWLQASWWSVSLSPVHLTRFLLYPRKTRLHAYVVPRKPQVLAIWGTRQVRGREMIFCADAAVPFNTLRRKVPTASEETLVMVRQ
ncbi:uncharacterized protein EV420DRAFT_1581522 [Desarmillaria tabescens]|uniref:Uncharacterized protein n=1 Tax=Armillaria tabescens TaxID=1929756 RepID=A0AA39JES6_ARMTA|nr:uncharacterized protein EV420DRAFT_1581522 [Desarmillaria tabescens]KAK0440655.1 hypothetical protein EV420DRAFT_1581522 [Desarmillaria tabescens]